jgi:hypothetical protein
MIVRASILAVPLSLFLVTSAMACGSTHSTAGTVVDATLQEVELDETKGEQVKALRVRIQQLVAAGKDGAARDAEEKAMSILGYKKVWLRCGPGTFAWMKVS